MKSIFALLCCLITQPVIAQDKPVVTAYYENWSQYRPPSGGRQQFMPNMIDPTIITDLNYAFGFFGFISKSLDPSNPHLTGDYSIQPVEWNDQTVLYPQVMALKQKAPDLRIFLSIGGWSFNDPSNHTVGAYTYKLFSEMAATEAGRQQFINSSIAYAHKWGFDGIDIDWEYPGDLTRGGTEEDFDNFVTLLQEAFTALHAAEPPLLLSIASAAIVPSGVPQSYKDNPASYFQWLAQCAPYLDRFNVMAYDYHGPFDVPKLTGVNAPLFHDTNPASTLYVAETLQNYISHGVPASKIVLGMPIYGHSYGGVSALSPTNNEPGLAFTSAGNAGPSTREPGLLAYFEISDMVALKDLTFESEVTTSTAYGWNSTTQQWVSFDTPDTIALKTQEAISQKLAGVMFWAVDNDEYQWGTKYPNIRSAYNILYP
ncbi:MAG: glycosyl hydrolase family 18 protein [Chlamydiales bacterium]|nr:glycosyl hydrolase family 18 protein [Chlamydiales bacterium]